MRDLNNGDDAGRGGGTISSGAEPEKLSPAEIANRAAVQWWEDFAQVVENPRASTYDFLKNTFLRTFDAEDAEDIGTFLSKAQQKTIREVLALTDLRELSKTIERFESNRLLISDPRARVGIKCARVLIDTYVSAKDEYDKELKKRLDAGQGAPGEAEQEEEIKRIVERKLADPDVSESIEAVAEAYTGKDKNEISKTVGEASKQLRENRSLSRMASDVVGVSKKYLKLDNLVNIGVHVLPLVTWQYRWAIALVFGAYVSRMAAVHGFKAVKARLWDGDRDQAKEEGHKAVTALKAAGRNVLAISISPLVGRLPARLAIWGSFAVTTAYNKTLEITESILQKKRALAPDGVKAKAADTVKGVWGHIKKFFKDNSDTLVILAAKAAKQEAPGHVTDKFQKASERVVFTRVKRVAVGVWGVGLAAGRRARGMLSHVFSDAAEAPPPVAPPAPAEQAAPTDSKTSDMNTAFGDAAADVSEEASSDDIPDIIPDRPRDAPSLNGPL